MDTKILLRRLFPEKSASSLDSLITILENVRTTSILSRSLKQTDFEEKELFLRYKTVYCENNEVQENLRHKAEENGIDSELINKYVKALQKHVDVNLFKGDFATTSDFYRFSEIANQLIYASFRDYLGFKEPELTIEGKKMAQGLSIYEKPYANENAQLVIDSKDPRDYILLGIERGIVSGADFCQGLGAHFGRLYTLNEQFREYVNANLSQKWSRPKIIEFLSSPKQIYTFLADDIGVNVEEIPSFKSEIEPFMLNTVKQYLQGKM